MLHSFARHMLELLLVAGVLHTAPVVAQDAGQQASNFSLLSVSGVDVTLDQFKGKYVVLEWMNFRCRTVDALYKNRVLPTMQAELKAQDIVWLSIVSEAQGKQGQVATEKMQRQIEKRGGNQDAVLLDITGHVGQAYGATVSPYLVVINPEGAIIYQGAFDNQPPGEEMDDDMPAINYVTDALEAAQKGEMVPYPVTEAYGCPIRYDR
ncbi:MAG: redoxin family protein [Bacteroidota bacterium]